MKTEMPQIQPTYLGNEELLRSRKVAFLAPSKISPLAVFPSYDWVLEAAKDGLTIVSGFSSPLEKDVWKLAAESGTSMITVLVRRPFKNIPSEYRLLLDEGRLLVVFLGIAPRLNRQTAPIRNEYVCRIADSIVFPCMNPDSSLFPLYGIYSSKCHKLI